MPEVMFPNIDRSQCSMLLVHVGFGRQTAAVMKVLHSAVG